MKQAMVLAAALMAAAPLAILSAGSRDMASGQYVEARTAEVFTGGCVMNSEAETMGKQAVLAWKVDHGSFNGVSLDGLSVVAALAGDRNLGMTEMGGAKASVRAALFVDERANFVQQINLVAMAAKLSNGLVSTIVQVTPAPIQFVDSGAEIQVSAGPKGQFSLDVSKHMPHDPSCGAMQWFHPLGTIDEAEMGLAAQHVYAGPSLGTKWSDPNKRSAFFGTFSY